MKNNIKKSDTVKIIYVALFIAIISLPLFQMTTKYFNLPKLNEKREKLGKPNFSLSAFKADFTSKYESYFNDNYGFRDQFIMLNNAIDVKLLGINTNPKSVVIGKNDYLYSSEELNDYNRENLLPDYKIEKIAKNLLKLQKDLEKQGTYFLFTIAPNKSTIYPEFMPFEPKFKEEESNYDRLQKEIERLGINTLDFRKVLFENKPKYDLYFKRDTHWNDIGSFLATEELLKNLSSKYPISDMPKIKAMNEEVYEGDLDGLLGLKSWIKEYKLDIDYGDTTEKLPKMICYVDSFSYNVLPKITPYNYNRIDNHNISADMHSNLPYTMRNTKIIYFEIVERYIPKLYNYDFDLFDNSLEELEVDYKKTSLPFTKTATYPKLNELKYIYLADNKDGSYYMSSHSNDSYALWDLDHQNIDYLYLDLPNPPREIAPIQIFWSTAGKDFGEEHSVKFVVTPLKTKYLIDLRGLNIKNADKFRFDLGEKANIELDINKIMLLYK